MSNDRNLSAATILGAAAVIMLFTGCQAEPRGVEIPPGSSDLEPCAYREIAVDNIPGIGAPGCDLAGSILTFTGVSSDYGVGRVDPHLQAKIQTVPGIGVTHSAEDSAGSKLFVLNWGPPGLSITAVEAGQVIKSWTSTAEANDLQNRQMVIEGIRILD